MKALIAGSRGWKDPFPIDVILAGLDVVADGRGEEVTVIHGAAPKGADRVADSAARRWGMEVIREPVTPEEWARFKGGAGPIRNQRMIDKHHPDVFFAFRAYGKSNGTDDMVKKAEAAGIPTYVITGGNHPTD
jgi:hypothetical protein